MTDERRLARALALGLGPLVVLAVLALLTPAGAFALAGDSGSPGARLALDNLSVDRLDLSAATVEGIDTARLEVGSLEDSHLLVLERDVDVAGLVPGGGIYTLRVSAPTAAMDDAVVFTRRACVTDVGIGNLGIVGGLVGGLADGMVDDSLNAALADGYDPDLMTGLWGVLGQVGLVDFEVGELRAEIVALEAGEVRAEDITVTFGPRTTDPRFAGSCLE